MDGDIKACFDEISIPVSSLGCAVASETGASWAW